MILTSLSIYVYRFEQGRSDHVAVSPVDGRINKTLILIPFAVSICMYFDGSIIDFS
ncbi:hypothetical protein Bca101_064923 [Brassica carinata]